MATFSLGVLLNRWEVQLLTQHTHTHTPRYTKPALVKVGGPWEKVTCSTYVKWQGIPQYIFLSLNIVLAILCPPSPSRRLLTTLSSALTQTPLLSPTRWLPGPPSEFFSPSLPAGVQSSSALSRSFSQTHGDAPHTIASQVTGTHSLRETMWLYTLLSHHTVYIFPVWGFLIFSKHSASFSLFARDHPIFLQLHSHISLTQQTYLLPKWKFYRIHNPINHNLTDS